MISMHKVFIIQYQMLRNLEADERTLRAGENLRVSAVSI
jgi:hypothetical protein